MTHNSPITSGWPLRCSEDEPADLGADVGADVGARVGVNFGADVREERFEEVVFSLGYRPLDSSQLVLFLSYQTINWIPYTTVEFSL